MRWLGLIGLCVVLGAGLTGCTVGQAVDVLAKVPFADRTEKEINDWFDNRTIVDDKSWTSNTAVNGDPKVLLIKEMNYITINGTKYPAALCITQSNTLIGGQPLKYAALVGIDVLNNTKLFECGKIDLSTTSCDGDPMAVNVTSVHSNSSLENAFRIAVNQWLTDDIVKTLKSTTNKEGFANPAGAQPRLPAKVRGVLYNVTEDKGPPKVRTIGFIAE